MNSNRPPSPFQPFGGLGLVNSLPSDRLLKAKSAQPFQAERLDRELSRDRLARYGVGIGLGITYVLTRFASDDAPAGVVLALALFLTIWIMFTVVVANVSRMLPRISGMLDSDPKTAETLIAHGLSRWPLNESTRLMLYHRLAVLRYRQHRYPEAADISAALLATHSSTIRPFRPHLLLIVAECRIRVRDLYGAYAAVSELRRIKLTLSESLQSMLLQTHYEILAGYTLEAVTGWRDKVEMAELMPAQQCGAMHELIAIAAQRQQLPELAAWLMERSQLFSAQADPAYEARS